MAVAPKSQGAGVSTETSGAALSPLCPAVVDAGDVLILHVFWEGTASAPSPPGDWTLLNPGGTAFLIETTIARQWFYGKIAAGTEDGAAVACGTPAVTTQRGARIYSFSGRLDGSIAALIGGITHTSHANDPQGPTVVTPIAGSLAVMLVAQNDNNAFAAIAGESGGSWAEMVAEYTVALTPGFSLGCQTCIPTSDPGTVSGGSDNTTNDPCGVIGFYIKPTAAQTISPGGIATGEAFGTAKLNLSVSPSAAASAEAFGTTKVNPTVHPSAIASAEAHGTAVLTQSAGSQPITPSAIASAEAFGTAQLNLTIFPAAKTSDETFGTSSVNQQIAPTAIASEEAVGAPSIGLGISASGIASQEAVGSPSLNLEIAASGIASTETFGTSKINLKISPASIASSEAFGTSTVSSGGIVITGIPSEEAFGTPSLNLKIAPAGASSSEAFGTLKANLKIRPSGISSEEAFGTLALPTEGLTVSASGIESAEEFGEPDIESVLPDGYWGVVRTMPDGSVVGDSVNYPIEGVRTAPQVIHRTAPSWRLRGERLVIHYWRMRRKHTPLSVRLLFEDGSPLNLVDAQAAWFILHDYDGSLVLQAPCQILNRAEARVLYRPKRDDIPARVRTRGEREVTGKYLAGHFRVDWADETFLEWPLNWRFDVEIR